MGTAAEVLRPHDCLAHARAACRRPLRPAGRRTAAARHHHHHHQGQRHGDIARGSAAAGTAPRQVRTKVADAYAGPAFGAMSPSPRALPLPRFTPRTAGACAAASEAPGVDDAATRELRRLLGLH
ncbi:unnamed protein product [Urochloa decumbens]|uniref:Uncharacterized protein n=1 Tax=Urochloa decumbens TaxID=240449 RepID=A0ABC8WI11_9POAL